MLLLFSCKSSLVCHIHTLERNHIIAKSVDFSFTKKSYLVEHIQRCTGEKQILMKCVDLLFQRRKILSNKQTHTEGKPLSCEECRSSFSYKSELMEHLQRHWKITIFLRNVPLLIHGNHYY